MPYRKRPFPALTAALVAGCCGASLVQNVAVAGGAAQRGEHRQQRGSGNAVNLPFNLQAPQLPDPRITPDDTLEVTAADICTPGYAGKVRNVPQSVKEQAYRNYGILHREKGEYEVDHLISLQLGGSNSIRNLWPKSFLTRPWNAHVKDQLETRLHSEICSGKTDMRVAQQEIARDWIAAYRKHFHTQAPLSDTAASGGRRTRRIAADEEGERDDTAVRPTLPTGTGATPTASTAPAGQIRQVWVNLKAGVYWRAGTRYFFKTKQGKYLSSEAAAIKAGYKAAGGQ